MAQMKRYEWTTLEYADAFSTLLRCYSTREPLFCLVRSLFDNTPTDAVAVDWGAGTGELTQVLLDKTRTVYAVEPGSQMRATLATTCPKATIINGTILSTVLPQKAHVALMSHVLYHIPDKDWGAHILHAANQLDPQGVLLVVLKDPNSGCNNMLEHFGAPRFDLPSRIHETKELTHHFTFSFSFLSQRIETQSFEDILKIARFVMADRKITEFSSPPTEEQFQEYVRTHLWDERKQVGGYAIGDVCCIIRPASFKGVCDGTSVC